MAVVSGKPQESKPATCDGDKRHVWKFIGEDRTGAHFVCRVCGEMDTD